ncbi:hypothetical protein [Ancylobacter dichloromethanicus]
MLSFSASSKSELGRWFPMLDLAVIEREAGFYLILRNASSEHPSPQAARKRIESLRRRCFDLFSDLQAGALGPLRGVIDQAAPPGCRSSTTHALAEMTQALATAENRIPLGRRRHPHHSLVLNLAAILRDKGLDAAPKGGSPLCRLVEIVLASVGELEAVANRSDAVLKIVRGAYGLR